MPPKMDRATRGALAAWNRTIEIADRINEELDDITAPHALQTGGFEPEDSVVTTIGAAMGGRKR